jgi:microcystin-dependent protein
MSDPYIGEIRMFGGSFAPAGWAFCDGTLMAISENDTLFNLIGTTYGGDGQSTFALPDLRGRVPLHQGTKSGITYVMADNGGVENVTLTTQQIPLHTHPLMASSATATSPNDQNNTWAKSTAVDLYINEDPAQGMNNQMIGPAGGSQPHTNLQPFLGINFIISLFGIYPSQT